MGSYDIAEIIITSLSRLSLFNMIDTNADDNHSHGAQGILNSASKQTLENEFGTKDEDEILTKILENGKVQAVEAAERQGGKNDTKGSLVAH